MSNKNEEIARSLLAGLINYEDECPGDCDSRDVAVVVKMIEGIREQCARDCEVFAEMIHDGLITEYQGPTPAARGCAKFIRAGGSDGE